MHRLAIVTTHPIQYNAPLFKLLASQPGLDVKVFYTLGEGHASLKDRGFGKAITWDIPLLDGYAYEFLENISSSPGTSHFRGVINPGIIQAIDSFNPDSVLVYGWSFDSHLKVIRFFKDSIPVYFRGDSTLLNDPGGFKAYIRKLFLSWVYSHIFKAFYVGAENKKYYLKYGLDHNQLVFAPHAIDIGRFGDDARFKSQAQALRSELNIPASHVVFAYIGKFDIVKNTLLLLDAFKEIKSSNTHLLFVGNGKLESQLKAAAHTQPNVHFLPFQNQSVMPAIYRVADVFVLPSRSETWGLSVNEAMACGLPVLVSNKVGCAADLVHEHKNGYVFESDNLESLISTMHKMAALSKNELCNIGISSRTIIQDWTFKRARNIIVSELIGSAFIGADDEGK